MEWVVCNMAGSSHIPSAKITPPRIGVPLLKRERLLPMVQAGIARRLLLVCAEAGYGKTSLLLSALPEAGMPAAWLTLDESDADPNLLGAGLIAAVCAVVPDFGAQAQSILTAGPETAELGRALLGALDTLPETVIVLDDFHTVERNPEVVRLVDNLLGNLPPPVHLVIATRTWPRLQNLPRLLVQGQATTVDHSHLKFTQDETATFFRTSHGLDIDDLLAGGLTERTEGWPAALQLIALRARTQGRADVHGTPREIYDYLAATVLDTLDPLTRGFVLRVSILTELWPSVCQALAPEVDAQEMLAAVEGRSLFLYRLDDAGPRYRFHQLFAEFLRQRLNDQEGSQTVSALHYAAAQQLEAEGAPDVAVRHYFEAGALGEAERVMKPLHGDRLTSRLAYAFRDLVLRLPEDVQRHHPWMTRCGASACRYVGDYAGGLALAQRTAAAARGRDPNLWAFSMHGIAVMLLHMDRFAEAERTCRDALASLAADVEPRWKIALLAVLADSLLHLGRLAEAEGLLPAIEQAAPEPQPGKGLRAKYFRAALATARLEFRRAAEEYRAALEEAAAVASLTYETWILTDIVAVELARRNLAAARGALERAQGAHARTGERLTDLRLTNHAGSVALLARDLSEAARLYQRTLELWRDGETQEPRLQALLGLARVARAQGNPAEAESLLHAASSSAERCRFGKLLPEIRLEQISVLYAQGEAARAAALLPTVRDAYSAWGALPGLARAALWEAQLSAPASDRLLHSAVSQAAQTADDLIPFLAEEAAWTAPLLLTAIRRGIEPRAAEELLVAMGPHAVDALVQALADAQLRHRAIALLGTIGDPRARRPLLQLARKDVKARAVCEQAVARLRAPEPVSLRLSLLGRFEVLSNGKPIPDAAWRTQKVKTLLKFLLLHRSRSVSHDEIIEALWPGVDPRAGEVRLKGAVKILRQTLEPLLEGRRSTFIVRSGSGFRFEAAGRCWIDLEEYDRLLGAARNHEAAGRLAEAVTALEQAAALYRGDLLEEDRYADWPAAERERRREIQIAVLETLADLHARRRDYRRALDAIQRVLALDRLREPAYRLLMQYALARGDRQAAIRAYLTCEQSLREELGVGPQPETVALYAQARALTPA
ncbi:MAG TPA: BTAD domain-containing putative transcriptional regulator [bacterium]|nr:BTAD domain-containing putative transcriptional regulator [bacterium]